MEALGKYRAQPKHGVSGKGGTESTDKPLDLLDADGISKRKKLT